MSYSICLFTAHMSQYDSHLPFLVVIGTNQVFPSTMCWLWMFPSVILFLWPPYNTPRPRVWPENGNSISCTSPNLIR